MERIFLLAAFLFSITSVMLAQNIIKKKFSPNNKHNTDSLKNGSDFLPHLNINSLDSLIQESKTIQRKTGYNMPMVAPDPNVRYNMPMVVPDPNVKYNMPMYKGPNGSENDADTTIIKKKIIKNKNAPKRNPRQK